MVLIIALSTLLVLPFNSVYSQEQKTEIKMEQESIEKTLIESDEKDGETTEKEITLKEALSETKIESEKPSLSFFQILIALLAPTTFILIIYLLIKKFNL